ncbi:MAG: pilus assembly protein PilM [Oscillospiraceae bacterium]|nr:pilus assembly protein PilM [Oscillospiraceae bacterium]
MAKTYLGIDVGHDMLKLALVRGGVVKKTAAVPMPLNLLREGHVTSTEALGELIAKTIRENRIRAGNGAVILSGDVCYLRTVAMPRMNAEQLAYNIPYEFSDYITGELKSYIFDYAVVPPLPVSAEGAVPEDAEAPAGDENGENRMQLLLSAVPSAVMDDWRAVMRKAGLKLAKAAPAECAYLALIRDYERRTGERDAEHCILDLGFRAIRMYMFRGPRHIATRVLDIGLSSLNDIIAEQKGVDRQLAHTYLLTDFENVQSAPYCRAAYDSISVELMRALNFYRFSNPDSSVNECWLGGGGAEIMPLRDSIRETLDIDVRIADELVRTDAELVDGFDYIQAIGIGMD